MKIVAQCIAATAHDYEGTAEETRARVNELCARFPLY